jgi:hypothetical protein
MSKPTGRPNGRPPIYTKELADSFLLELCSTRTMTDICNDEGMPSISVVSKWIITDEDGFKAKYASARKVQAAIYADETVTIARSALAKAVGAPGTGIAGARVQACKLEIDALKWHSSKLDSSTWGHKTSTELTGKDGGPIQTAAPMELTDELKAELDKINLVTAGMRKPEGIE